MDVKKESPGESLLEMLYFHPMMELLQSVYGVRSAANGSSTKVLGVSKPSRRNEAHCGYDQAWHNTGLSCDEFRESVQRAIRDNLDDAEHFYVAYFLQYKVVEHMVANAKPYEPGTNKGQIDSPFYRAKVDTSRDTIDEPSQHEILRQLNRVAGADVHYACPMLFGTATIELPKIDSLRLVPLAHAADYSGEFPPRDHYIAWRDETAQPQWYSEPIPAKSYGPDEWLSDEVDGGPRLFHSLTELNRFLNEALSQVRKRWPTVPVKSIFRALSVVELGPHETEAIL
jgi:hypothetical protein